MKGSNEQEQGATPSGSGCQPSGPQPASQSSQSGIPSADKRSFALRLLAEQLDTDAERLALADGRMATVSLGAALRAIEAQMLIAEITGGAA